MNRNRSHKLKSLKLDSGTLEAEMFEGREDIESVVLTNCAEIPEFCFSRCVNLREVTVQGSLKTIRYDAFSGCGNLEVFSAPDAKDLNICFEAFRDCKSLKRFDCFPKAAWIDPYAFAGCRSLEKIDLGSSLNNLAKSAFQDCDLTRLTLADNQKYYVKDGFVIERATVYDEQDKAETVMRALYYLKDDENVVIPSEVQKLSDMCFKGRRIRSITLPPTMDDLNDTEATDDRLVVEEFGKIGNEFYHIPTDYTMQLQDPFYKCKSLASINVSEGSESFTSIGGVLYSKDGETLYRVPPAREGAFAVPEGVTSIHDYAFSGTAVTTVMLPASVEHIGHAAFRTGPQHVEVSADNPKFKKTENLLYEHTKQGNGVLFCDRDTRTPSFKSNTNYIREYAFENCSRIRYCRLPLKIKEIGGHAFAGCTSLMSMSLPPFQEDVESGLFEGCISLERLDYPRRLKTIADRILAGCSQKITIRIRDNEVLMSDEMYADTNCSITYDIAFRPDGLSYSDLFDYDNIRGFIVTPSDSFPLGCTDFSEATAMYEGIQQIGQNKATPAILLRVPSAAKTFEISESCFFIQTAAFYYCPKLEEIYIPDNVKVMMENAIWSADSCKVLRLPEDLTIIARDSKNTQYKVTPETAKMVGSECRQLEKIIIGDREYLLDERS